MKAAAIKKLIPASALAMTLVVFTSCRIDKLVPELEPYLQEITGTDSTTFMNALASASPSNTNDFKEGFRSGYAAGYAEAAKLSLGNVAPVAAPASNYPSAPSSYSSTSLYSSGPSTSSSSSEIPSWGYTSNAIAKERTAPKPKPQSRSRRSSGGG